MRCETMMEFRQVTAQLTVSPQIHPLDLRDIAQAGYTHVINNRPNGEEESQPLSEQLQISASKYDLGYDHIPVIGGEISDKDVSEFRAILDRAAGPVFAFCRTGTRSIKLWALACRDLYTADEIISLADKAGYDLTALKPLLEK